jgi:type IV secretory pathway TrbD component
MDAVMLTGASGFLGSVGRCSSLVVGIPRVVAVINGVTPGALIFGRRRSFD